LTATLKVEKRAYDMTEITFESASFVYDSQAKSLAISGTLPEGVEVNYIGNNKVTVGEYTVTAQFVGDSTYAPIDDMTATLTITKATIDMSGVIFDDATYVYDGTEKTVEITGELPEGVTVSYENNTLTNVDEVTATANFTVADALNYNEIASMTATLKITVKEIDVSGVGFNEAEGLIYDGTAKEVKVNAETLPEGVEVAGYVYAGDNITENEAINAGEYTVTASLKATDELNTTINVETVSTTFEIGKATIDMSGVEFNDATFTYDGEAKSVEITGELPENVEVSYVGNGQTEVGDHPVTANFTVTDTLNYNAIDSMTAIKTDELRCDETFDLKL